MGNLASIAASPRNVTIVKDGTEELLYPLRFMELGILEQWMRSRVVKAAADAISGMERRDATIVMRAASYVAAQVNVMNALLPEGDLSLETMAHLRSFEGMLRVLQLSLRESAAKVAKPKYTLPQLDEMLNNDTVKIQELFLNVIELSFPGADINTEDKDADSDPNEDETKE